MKCPKCGYTSFPYASSCGKCGRSQLAEARVLYGVYALPPDAPDLMRADEPLQADEPLRTDSTDIMPRGNIPSPAIDLSQLNEIDLELANPDDTTVAGVEGEALLELVEENAVELELEALLDDKASPLPVSPEPDVAARHDAPGHPTLDLSGLPELTLELEDPGSAASPSSDQDQLPTMADAKQIFELDLEDEDVSLTLTPVEQAPPVPHDNEDDEPEYILEIDDEFELTVEQLDVPNDPDETTDDVEEDDDVR